MAATQSITDKDQRSKINIFSAAGRLGRVRFIGYSLGITFVFYLFIAAVAGIGSMLPGDMGKLLVGVVGFGGYVAILWVQFLLLIQRSHDFNASGWLSLLIFMPLAVLVFWFVPGTKGDNQYGKPTPPNGAGAILLAALLPVMIIGILAAIAIPAYHDYVKRARAAAAAQQVPVSAEPYAR
ncbi:MAG: hypothetical protein A2140_08955 [Candidatus Muproteobacteria bacterium RBG_16_62_13]|uniref:DUF805 domain-containing protein n=1 Tax=Candidatus Muproteobacteria bacterium RBG_16_62_13 TaxID=1817756 RepID=A0A1F6T8N1_9PROT|nr:MAG: hypothetical protein A2140_08955 [Candidatus Muproteobacteria bacterium RBG_16_62_13]